MDIKQHYVVNLKRRPIRLGAWIGAQYQMGFDFRKLTVVEAYDAETFKNRGDMLKEVGDFFLCHGLDYRNLYDDKVESPKLKGLLGNMISTIIIISQIEKTMDTNAYFMLWEDDTILRRPYQELMETPIPDDATILAFRSPYGIDKLNVLEKHTDFPFLYGTVGTCANQAVALNKRGAEIILDIFRKDKWLKSLETIFAQYRGELKKESFYTYTKDLTGSIHIMDCVSDIHHDKQRKETIYYNSRPAFLSGSKG